MKTDKKRRSATREMRKKLKLTIADRVTEAFVRTTAKQNPEAVKQAAQPVLEAAEKWERILSLEPGSEAALELERVSGKSLAELKIQAEMTAGFLRGTANISLSLIK